MVHKERESIPLLRETIANETARSRHGHLDDWIALGTNLRRRDPSWPHVAGGWHPRLGNPFAKSVDRRSGCGRNHLPDRRKRQPHPQGISRWNRYDSRTAQTGTITVLASASGLPSVTFSVPIPAEAASWPRIAAAGVGGAGLSSPFVRALSNGGIATIFGQNFGPNAVFRKVSPENLIGGKVPTVFGTLCVEISGSRVPIFGVSSTQLNFQARVPENASSATVTVVSDCDTPTPRRSNTITVPVQDATPEFFYFRSAGDGRAAINLIRGEL